MCKDDYWQLYSAAGQQRVRCCDGGVRAFRPYSTGRHLRHMFLVWLKCEMKDLAFAGPLSNELAGG